MPQTLHPNLMVLMVVVVASKYMKRYDRCVVNITLLEAANSMMLGTGVDNENRNAISEMELENI